MRMRKKKASLKRRHRHTIPTLTAVLMPTARNRISCCGICLRKDSIASSSIYSALLEKLLLSIHIIYSFYLWFSSRIFFWDLELDVGGPVHSRTRDETGPFFLAKIMKVLMTFLGFSYASNKFSGKISSDFINSFFHNEFSRLRSIWYPVKNL